MRKAGIVLIAVMGATIFAPPWAARSQDPPQTQVFARSAIRKVLEAQVRAWNGGDIDAFMKGYDDSPRTTFVGKTVEYGYAAILARYKKHYSTPAAMGKLEFTNLNTRMLGAHYAAVTGNFHLTRTAAAGGDAEGIFSLVLEKIGGTWKIILDHTS